MTETTSPIEEGKLQYDDVYTYTFIPDHEYSWATRGGEGTYTVKINHDDTYYYSEPFVIHALNEAQELNRLADIADITEEHSSQAKQLVAGDCNSTPGANHRNELDRPTLFEWLCEWTGGGVPRGPRCVRQSIA